MTHTIFFIYINAYILKRGKLFACYKKFSRVCGTQELTNMDVAKLDNFDDKKEDEVVLPGFRFHPTDEELVGFYLRRKVDNKPLRIELIKEIDIYKYDPWDLPSKILFSSHNRC